jgi:hypothetical protein
MQTFPSKLLVSTMLTFVHPTETQTKNCKMHFCNTKIVLFANVACSADSFSCFYCVVILILLYSSYFSLYIFIENYFQAEIPNTSPPKIAIFCSGLDKLHIKMFFNSYKNWYFFVNKNLSGNFSIVFSRLFSYGNFSV